MKTPTTVWRISPSVVAALDERFGDPVDAYVNGSQTWFVDNGPGFAFLPQDLQIQVGDTVTRVWKGGVHTVYSSTGGLPNGIFGSGTAAGDVGHTFSVTFDAAFLAANPQDKFGKHAYTFAETALDEGELRERARRYQEYFDVPSERLP